MDFTLIFTGVGGTREKRVREAGPPDPLHPSIRHSLKKTPGTPFHSQHGTTHVKYCPLHS